MASENIEQIFIANPITTNAATDLMYFGQSPYGTGDDAAMTFANFQLQFPGLTGARATGTWGISISGNAATATSATTAGSSTIAGSATTAANLTGLAASTLYGNPTGSTATGRTISLGTNLSLSGTTLNAASSSGITTIDDDLGGSVTGSTINITGGTLGGTNISGSTVSFQAQSATELSLILSDENTASTILGAQAGNSAITGLQNVGLGFKSLLKLSSGAYNVALGAYTGHAPGSGTTGITTGSYNVLVGTYAGGLYTSSESNNVLINNGGVVGESNVLRISSSGTGVQQVSKAFIGGIYGVAAAGTQQVAIAGSGDQLGSATSLPVTLGGTGLTATTINRLLYSSATNTIAGLPTVNNGVLGTSASGVPAISTTLPAGLTIPTPSITGRTAGSLIASGNFGSVYQIQVAEGAAVPITSNTATNVGSVSMPAGNFLVFSDIGYIGVTSATTVTELIGYTTATSTTLSSDRLDVSVTQTVNPAQIIRQACPVTIWEMNAPWTLYLGGYITYTGTGTLSAFGNAYALQLP